jgi:YebC/PmpR family DNA-binding regulatory protein
MSGHSKWSKIKRQKAVTDVKKGAVYAKLAREIIVAARDGGDPAGNFRLRQAIEKAKVEGLPNENIQRAIEKGSGAAGGANLEELIYEGYGPGGVAILVRCATDNRNRTAGDLRYAFSKHGGNLGESGCVGWMFKERGELRLAKSQVINEDELILTALDSGAYDVEIADDSILITCEPQQLSKLQASLETAGYKVESAENSMDPGTTVEVSDPDIARKLLSLLEVLEELEDIQQVFSNFEMDNALLETSLA